MKAVKRVSRPEDCKCKGDGLAFSGDTFSLMEVYAAIFLSASVRAVLTVLLYGRKSFQGQ